MQFLKANTAVDVRMGPFVDVGDGFTPQTDIGNPGTDLTGVDEAELLKHNGAATVDLISGGNAWAAVTGCDGWYDLTLSTDDTNTEGLLDIVIQDDSDCLPVHKTFMVLAEAAYDSMFAAKDAGFMDVNVKTIGRADAQETEADNLESACSNYSATRGLTGTALPAVAAGASGGVPLGDASGRTDVGSWLGSAVTKSANNRPDVNVDEWHDVLLATTNPLPNAAADDAGGLPISDAGGLDLDGLLGNQTIPGDNVGWLKISTAVGVKLGPFLDAQTGDPQTGLTFLQSDIRVSQNGGAFLQTTAGSPSITHDENGWYTWTVPGGDLASPGPWVAAVAKSGSRPVRVRGTVVSAITYAGMVAGSDVFAVDVAQIGGQNVTAEDPVMVGAYVGGTAAAATATALADVQTHGDSTWATATSVTVSDKTGFKLASDGLDLVTAWTVDITGTVSVLAGLIGSPSVDLATDIGALNDLSASDVNAQIVDVMSVDQQTESYAAKNAAATIVQLLYAIHQMVSDFTISGTTKTTRKLDSITTAMTHTLNDASSPTAIKRTT